MLPASVGEGMKVGGGMHGCEKNNDVFLLHFVLQQSKFVLFFCLFAWEEIALHRVVEKNYMPLPKKLKTKFIIVKDN